MFNMVMFLILCIGLIYEWMILFWRYICLIMFGKILNLIIVEKILFEFMYNVWREGGVEMEISCFDVLDYKGYCRWFW